MGAEVNGSTLDRRGLLAAMAASGAAAFARPAWASAVPNVEPRSVDLRVSDTRSTKMTVWQRGAPRGVALFSTGHGSWPDRYVAIANNLVQQGFAVLAPLHVDSVRHPDRARFTMQASFGERLADMNAAASHADATYPRLPMVAVGHSFGTLTGLCLAGGLDHLSAFRNPAVRAVLGFSSPGRIPGLVTPTAYARLKTPIMIVTGTVDTVPGFVADPADHLLPVETAPTPTYALVLEGGKHELVAGLDPQFVRAPYPAMAFAAAYGLGDAVARARLIGYEPAAGDRFIKRNAA